MKLERTKSATRSIFYGIALKVYRLVMPFLLRTAMIYFMGVQYLGLNSLFTSVLQVLNLAELGVGAAMVFSMYKPIAEDDSDTICALMAMYRLYYRIIGIVIGVIGGVLTPFIPRLIHGDVPNTINVYVLYLLNLATTVLSYWLFAYKSSILRAHQRNDVVSKVTIVTSTLQYGLQLLVLWLTRNYYYYVIVALLMQVLNNIASAICSDMLYPQYQPRGKLPSDEAAVINRKIADLFTAQLGYVVNNSVDSIVISAFMGLTALAIYNNYFLIVSSVTGLIMVVFDSVVAGIGNSLVTESDEKNFRDMREMTFIIFWLATFCSGCLLCLFQPFMELWVGKNLMLSFGHVVTLTAYFAVQIVRKNWVVVKDAAGIWHQDRFRPLIVAACNLGLNILLVTRIGFYGVMLSTILAELLISLPWLWHNIFTYVLHVDPRSYLVCMCKHLVVGFTSCVVCVLICSVTHLPAFPALLFNFSVCLVVTNGIQAIVYRKTPEFVGAWSRLRRIVPRRAHP